MNLLSLDQISKSRSGRLLLDNVTVGLDSGDRIGFIGANGMGKSTLLSILCKNLEPDSGEVHTNGDLKISILDQEVDYSEDERILDYIMKGDNPMFVLVKKYEECLDTPESKEYGKLLEEMDRLDGWALEGQIRTMLYVLGLTRGEIPKTPAHDEIATHNTMRTKMSSLSGGQRRRVALARALLGEFNLLILDEPTNHLDIPTILWLQTYLAKLDKALLLVSHDRYLIEECCNVIWELADQTIYKHAGGYKHYLDARTRRMEERVKTQDRKMNMLRNEMAWLRQGAKARSSKDKLRTEKVYDLLDSVESVEAHDLEFSVSGQRLGKKILKLKGVSKGFDGKQVINPFTYEFNGGQKIGILGPNGAGKTTFLNLLTGDLTPDTGDIDKGINTCFGYFHQSPPTFAMDMGVVEFLKETAPLLTLGSGQTLTPSQLLDWFNFPASLHFQPISTLSGGERRRLFLVNTLLSNPNFLLLDEPTNDLDIETLTALESFLEKFGGCLIVVSHDRYFLDRTCDFLFVLDGKGGIQGFPGNCTNYLDYQKEKSRLARQNALAEKELDNSTKTTRRENDTPKKAKLTFNEKREFEGLEGEIATLEEEQKELEAFFSSAQPAPDKLALASQRFNQIEELLMEKLERWEILGEKI